MSSKDKKPVLPAVRFMSKCVMHDGKEVLVMSPEQWNTYCYDYNQLNGVPQPPQLVKELQQYREEHDRKTYRAIEDKRN